MKEAGAELPPLLWVLMFAGWFVYVSLLRILGSILERLKFHRWSLAGVVSLLFGVIYLTLALFAVESTKPRYRIELDTLLARSDFSNQDLRQIDLSKINPPVNNSVLLIGIAPDFSLVAQQEEHLCAPPHQL